MVYFMQAVGGGPVKIGCSKDVEKRRAQLETWYDRPLAIVHVIEGDRETEKAIHQRFARLRIRKTEQFRVGRDLIAFIGKPLTTRMSGRRMYPKKLELTNPVRLDLSPETHRLLRRVAADEDKSMAAYARDLLESHLKDEAKRRGIKP